MFLVKFGVCVKMICYLFDRFFIRHIDGKCRSATAPLVIFPSVGRKRRVVLRKDRMLLITTTVHKYANFETPKGPLQSFSGLEFAWKQPKLFRNSIKVPLSSTFSLSSGAYLDHSHLFIISASKVFDIIGTSFDLFSDI